MTVISFAQERISLFKAVPQGMASAVEYQQDKAASLGRSVSGALW